MRTQIILTPAQRKTAEGLRQACASGTTHVLQGRAGSGKTTVLRWLHARCGGALLDALVPAQLSAPEESFLRMVDEAIERHDLLLVDNLHLLAASLQDDSFPRSHLLDAALTAILAEAAVRKKTLVFAVEENAPFPVQRRAGVWALGNPAG